MTVSSDGSNLQEVQLEELLKEISSLELLGKAGFGGGDQHGYQ